MGLATHSPGRRLRARGVGRRGARSVVLWVMGCAVSAVRGRTSLEARERNAILNEFRAISSEMGVEAMMRSTCARDKTRGVLARGDRSKASAWD